MVNLLLITLYISLIIHVVLIGISVWRVWRGDNVIDRLMGTELVTTLFLAVLVLVSLIFRESLYIDVALGLAALSFIGTVALAKYLADEQMF
ncbi:MAG: cation:proton antiporter [Chloroflexi bacterium]|nr:cation:proton antiporter [Chloroflexota bacterium]